MKVIGIIPARYSSTRFPGKPLVDIGGKTMIRRVYEQAIKAKSLLDVIVATDDEQIFREVENFGGKVMMTSPLHKNGTERCAEVAASCDVDVVVNIQGDEPFIAPEQIDLLASCFNSSETQVVTLIRNFQNEDEKQNSSCVKAFVNGELNALMFSRSSSLQPSTVNCQVFKHIGVYAYRKNVLLEIVKLLPTQLEISEKLEQLRWLQNGCKIKCAFTEHESISIDTPEDLREVVSNRNWLGIK